MKLSCPKDPAHKQFSASAHEVRGWIVDETGQFVKGDGQGCQQVAAGPDFYPRRAAPTTEMYNYLSRLWMVSYTKRFGIWKRNNKAYIDSLRSA